MNKAYSKINWKNDPDTATPLSATNLGATDEAIDTIDNRVIVLDTTKANQSDLLQCLKVVTYNESTGIMHMEWQNGSTLDIDLNVEKIPVSFSMSEDGVITMTNADGTTYTADIGSLIKTYNFVDSDQIDFTATLQEDGSYNVTGIIKDGSITDAMLESGYLASVTAQANSASTSSQNATEKATLAESYAKGGTNTRTGEDTDNAKYYSDRASALVDVDIATTSKAGIVKPDGTTITVDGNGLINAPGGHTHSNKATLDSITETDLTNWNAKADIDDIPVIATTSVPGTVKPDGTTITVDANGTITATAQSPDIATPLVAGIVKFDDETIGMDENNALYVIGGGGVSSEIVVTTDEGLVGQTITCTQGETVYSAVVDNTQTVAFSVQTLGTWTLRNPITGVDVEVEIIYYGRYTASLYCYKVYGVDIDFSMTNPTTMCTYTDDAVGMTAGSTAWLNTHIYALLKNCVLQDGEVIGYLKKGNLIHYEDGSTADITTLGNDVMLEIGARLGYIIEWDATDANLLHVKVTDNPNNPNFNYDAFSLDSYNDCDKIYIGVYKGFNSGSRIYSSSGRAVTTSQTIDTFRTWCRARGAGYQQRTYASIKLMQCLYLIMFKNLNSQASVGMGYVLPSHTAGVSTGETNAYGFNSEIIKASNPTYMTDQNHQVKCLGIEDFWGNYFEFVDGLCTDASRNVLTCKLAKDFVTNGTGYDNNGNGGVSANLNNYMSRPQGGSKAGFTAQTVAGSDSTYFCNRAALAASCLAYFGGAWGAAAGAGAFQLDASTAFSLSANYAACRLMYLHKEA